MGVGQFDPFKGIGIHRQIPLLYCRRCKACEQRKVAGDHQPLDVMRIGVAACFGYDLRQTPQRCVAGPEERRQGPLRVQMVAVRIAGHPGPIQAADILAPAQYLSHKTLDGIERCGAAAPLRDSCLAYLAW